MVASLEDAQKMDDPVQRGVAGEASANLMLDIQHSRSPFSVDSGVNDGEVDTEGVSQTSKLANLSLKTGEDLWKQNTTRALDIPSKKVVRATSSPVTPLEMPGSPTQSLKKMKSDVVEQIKMARLMLITRDKAIWPGCVAPPRGVEPEMMPGSS
ncbi:unnamed protein product [Triticum aestivum]|uniref:Uncharacterized protein n=1 Tax=Triticum aestivum TaxID=4565 RepID=A0A7H4LBU2_WHEAT|nr:unnamed protein product [Triticum aestivum]